MQDGRPDLTATPGGLGFKSRRVFVGFSGAIADSVSFLPSQQVTEQCRLSSFVRRCFWAPVRQRAAKPKLQTDELVAKAARDFRIHVYEAFRGNRPQYDALRAAGDELLQSWHDAGQPADYRDVVAHWYDEARLASHGGGNALPEQPVLPDPPVETSLATDDPTSAPHLPPIDRPTIDIGNPFSDISGDGGDLDFLGQPKPAAPNPQSSPSWTPPSKILRSLQRALLISVGDAGRVNSEAEKFDETGPFDSTGSNPFSFGDSQGNAPAADAFDFPALNEPQSDKN